MEVVARRAPHEIGRLEQASHQLMEVFSRVSEAHVADQPAVALDRLVRRLLARRGLQSALVGYRGYPAHCSVSPNAVAVHGVPGQRALQRGDVFTLDIAAASGGWMADMAWTYLMPGASHRSTDEYAAAWRAYRQLLSGVHTGMTLEQLAVLCEDSARAENLRPIKEFTGHGIGRDLHEPPVIPLAREAARGTGPSSRIRLLPGMVVSIEPVYRPVERRDTATVVAEPDGWAYRTSDDARTYHFELTVAFREDGPWILQFGCATDALPVTPPLGLASD